MLSPAAIALAAKARILRADPEISEDRLFELIQSEVNQHTGTKPLKIMPFVRPRGDGVYEYGTTKGIRRDKIMGNSPNVMNAWNDLMRKLRWIAWAKCATGSVCMLAGIALLLFHIR